MGDRMSVRYQVMCFEFNFSVANAGLIPGAQAAGWQCPLGHSGK